MLTFATSVLHEYRLIWSGDPALKQPELAPLADETPEAFQKRKDDAFELLYMRAVEAGQWDDIIRPGAQPTVFWCRPIPGSRFRALLDYTGKEDSDIGGHQRPALALRLACTRIDNFAPGFKFATAEHVDKRGDVTGLGKMLTEDVIDILDNVDPMIVSVLGYAILKNRRGPHPL